MTMLGIDLNYAALILCILTPSTSEEALTKFDLLPEKTMPKAEYVKSMDSEVERLYRSGMSFENIGRIVGFSHDTVYRTIKRLRDSGADIQLRRQRARG